MIASGCTTIATVGNVYLFFCGPSKSIMIAVDLTVTFKLINLDFLAQATVTVER